MTSQHLIQPLDLALHHAPKAAFGHLARQIGICPAQMVRGNKDARMLLVPVCEVGIGLAAHWAQGTGDEGNDEGYFWF